MGRLRVAILTILALGVAAPWNSAQSQEFPARTVTTVVPFAAGGAGDILSRILSKHLEQRLGKPFVVENKPGGGGTTGAVLVAKSSPDGHTLLMSPSGPIAVNPVRHQASQVRSAASSVRRTDSMSTPGGKTRSLTTRSCQIVRPASDSRTGAVASRPRTCRTPAR